MATYDYKGTKITGTSTNASKFPGSGVKNAHVGDTYLNKSTGHVYKCTEGGGSSSAKWKYTKTVVVKKPNVAVKSLGAPQRSSYVMKADWKIPKSLTEKTNGRRASNIVATWSIGSLKRVDTGNAAKNTSSLNLGGFTASNGKVYNRTSFYPVNKSRKLNGVSVSVVPKNAKGTGTQPVSASRAFGVPRKPKIDTWTFVSEGADAGKISCKIKTDAGTDALERYDTYYIMKITDTSKPRGEQTWNKYNTSSQSTQITPFYDVANYQQLSYDDYVKIYVSAWARGYAGDSEHVPSTYYVSYPKAATIKDVGVSSTDQTGKCTVYINTNNTTEHPVDQVRLEYLANCEYPDASLIPGDEVWTSSDIVDNAACTALTIPVTNLIPDRGKYTWVRVKSWHAVEAILNRYSVPWRVKQLETPAATAADDDITILDTEAGADGESVIVHLGWNKDGTDDSTGTELSWSDAEDAWRSTDDPETYEFTWSDGSVTSGGVTYHDSATITIKGLEESTVYYIKARRYLEGDETTYSDYSNPATQLTSETPDSVVASCASYVPSDGSLAVSWTFSSDSLQTAWQIVDTNGTVIADGQSSLGATQISAERIAQFATNNSLTFTVQVSTGSGYVVSEEHTVTIVDPPTLEITDTSLVEEEVEINPRTFTGDLVSFTTEAEEIATELTIPLAPIQDTSGGDPSPTNICPISGWDGVNGYVRGKNMINIQTVNVSAGTQQQPTISDAITLDAGTYTLSYTLDETVTATRNRPLYSVGSTDVYSPSDIKTAGRGSWTFTLSNETTLTFKWWAHTVSSDCTISEFQLEKGTTATTYEPYNGTTYPVNLSDTAGTVYGGTLDVVSGELTVDHAMVTIDGSQSITWSQGFGNANYTRLSWLGITVKPSTSSQTRSSWCKTNRFPYLSAATWAEGFTNNNTVAFSVSSDDYFAFNTGERLSNVNTWLSSNPIQLYYPLATPQTYQLTPTQIMTLIGDNNVWSDAGSLTLKIAEGYGTQLTLQDMPMTVTVQTNAPCDLTQIISAQGAVGQFPEGVRRQTLNDTIYSDVLSPEWTESNGVFSTTLSYPAGLDFWNLAGYTYTLTATDQVTGLQSEQVSFPFVVDWTNPAVSPVLITYTATSDTAVNDEETYYEKVGDNYLEVDPVGTENPSALGWYTQTITSFVTLTPQDYTDDDGFHHQSVEIALTPPTGSTSSDLYDIYRLTGDGSYLIGEGFPLTHTVTDEYAPFGDNLTHHYRFAIRTVEGDVAFADIEYTADGSVMRFDWTGGSLELPYNISIGDSYSKDVEIREHLNGTNDAYWRKNITRKGSLSSDVIRLDQQDEIMSARALAHYAGAVFVRTPDGSAYEADVQVSDLSTDGGPLTQIAVDATEIGLTQEFELPIPTSGA